MHRAAQPTSDRATGPPAPHGPHRSRSPRPRRGWRLRQRLRCRKTHARANTAGGPAGSTAGGPHRRRSRDRARAPRRGPGRSLVVSPSAARRAGPYPSSARRLLRGRRRHSHHGQLPGELRRRAWVSFSCRDGEHVGQGEPLAQCIDAIEGCAQIVAVGVNCTAPRHISSLVAIASSRTAKPVVVYPNSGERFDVAARRWHGDVAVGATLAEQADQWYRLGARLIGGCCRTTPDDIRALRAWAASLQ